MKPEELKKIAEEYVSSYVDMGHFRHPDVAYPYVLDGFQHGFRQAEKIFDEAKFVPGHFKCAKCSFYLIAKNLYIKSGITGPNREPQMCANGCGPMWRVAWLDWAKDREEITEKNYKEIEKLKSEVAVAIERFGPAGYKIIQEVAELRERLKKYEPV